MLYIQHESKNVYYTSEKYTLDEHEKTVTARENQL